MVSEPMLNVWLMLNAFDTIEWFSNKPAVINEHNLGVTVEDIQKNINKMSVYSNYSDDHIYKYDNTLYLT